MPEHSVLFLCLALTWESIFNSKKWTNCAVSKVLHTLWLCPRNISWTRHNVVLPWQAQEAWKPLSIVLNNFWLSEYINDIWKAPTLLLHTEPVACAACTDGHWLRIILCFKVLTGSGTAVLEHCQGTTYIHKDAWTFNYLGDQQQDGSGRWAGVPPKLELRNLNLNSAAWQSSFKHPKLKTSFYNNRNRRFQAQK